MKRALGFVGLFSLAAGAMISSGIFVLPAIVFSQVGPGLWISYLVAGAVATLGVLGVVELTTAMPRAGGNYFSVTRSLGPFFGTLAGVMSWFAVTLKSSFAVYGLAALIASWTGLPLYPVAVALVVLFVAVSLLGSEAAGSVETVLVFLLLAVVVSVIVLGAPRIEPANLSPVLLPGRGVRDLLIATGLVFVSFGGLVNVTSVAGEVKRPGLTIPAATIGALVVVTVLYGLLIRTAIGVSGAAGIDGATNPIAETARLIAGGPGFFAVTVAAVLAFVTTAIAGVLSASRYPFALAGDGLAPAFLGRTRGRRAMPVASVVLTGAVMAATLALDLRLLVEAASVVIALNYLLSNVSVIVMRSSGLVGYRPRFRVPGYPVVPVVAVLVYVALVVDMGWEATAIAGGFVAASAAVYLVFGRRADRREYALQHLVARLTSRDLPGGNLEGELRGIVHESHGIVTDRFDDLVTDAVCIDLPGAHEARQVFADVAARVAPEVGMDEQTLLAKLVERESESSTALSPFVAVPHIVLPGSGGFRLVLVRTADGTRFDERAPAVRAMFVLMGTADERNFHLQALTAIAQVVQDPAFDRGWLAVRKESQLKDFVLLQSRRRHS